jgi:hypothetical protein
MQEFSISPAIQALARGEIRVEHYKAVLREMYHYAKEDPQIQAFATAYFRGEDRALVKLFLKHATAEVGHDLMALEDLRHLGDTVDDIPATLPLPATVALTAFPFYQIQFHNPIGYLGYLYFLEHMPTSTGATYAKALQTAGVPDSALSFLREHMTVDVAHNNLMLEYLSKLVRTDADLGAVCHAISVTGYLYGEMLAGAIRSAEVGLGSAINHSEIARLDRSRTTDATKHVAQSA